MFNLETLKAVCIVVERSWLAPAVITVRVMNAQINRNFFQRPGIHGDLLISSLWPVKLGRLLIGLSACVCKKLLPWCQSIFRYFTTVWSVLLLESIAFGEYHNYFYILFFIVYLVSCLLYLKSCVFRLMVCTCISYYVSCIFSALAYSLILALSFESFCM